MKNPAAPVIGTEMRNALEILNREKPYFTWRGVRDRAFENFIAGAREYVRKYGNFSMHASISKEERKVYAGVQRFRNQKRLGTLPANQEKELNEIPCLFDTRYVLSQRALDQFVSEATKYVRQHGHFNFPRHMKVLTGNTFGGFLQVQRCKKKAGKLSKTDEEKLNSIPGFSFDAGSARLSKLYANIQRILEFLTRHADFTWSKDFSKADQLTLMCVKNYRSGIRTGRTSIADVEKLKAAVPQIFENLKPRDRMLDEYERYVRERKTCYMSSHFISDTGYRLGENICVVLSSVRRGHKYRLERFQNIVEIAKKADDFEYEKWIAKKPTCTPTTPERIEVQREKSRIRARKRRAQKLRELKN